MEFLSVATIPLYICMGGMVLAFLAAVKWNYYSIVDAVWAYMFTIVTFVYAGLPSVYPARNILILIMVSLWSLRLGTHLFFRLRAHYPKEDGRYDELRVKWAKTLKLNFFIFFLFQGLSVVILSLPFLLISLNPRQGLSGLEFLGILVWLVGFTGEAIADQQLKKFAANPANKGKVCEAGLWNYSRHPNYFFEWLIWVGYFLMAFAGPSGWMAITSPALILYLLLKVTGIPYTERQSLKSRGELFKHYQKTTSAFVPWFKKKAD